MTEKRSLIRRVLEYRARPLPRRAQLIVVVSTVVLLVGASIWGWRSTHLSFSAINWWAIAVAFFVAAPATLILKMFEYDATARLLGQRATVRRALEVSIVSSAANLLPLPGSLLVTTHSLSEQGATYGTAAYASAIPGLAWLGLAGLIGGVAIMIAGNALVGVAITLGGAAALVGAYEMFRRSAPVRGRPQLAARIVVIETSWIFLSGFRLWLVLEAIGVKSTTAQVLALAVAGAMSVAIGFFPGGLGAREALIALLSPIIKLPLSEGIVLGVIDRVVWISFLALAAIAITIPRARARSHAEVTAAEAGMPRPGDASATAV